MSEPTERCAVCGYPQPRTTCGRCHGEVRSPRTGAVPRRGPGMPLADLVDGFTSVFGAALSLLHGREYIGKLTLPILANLAALTLCFGAMFYGVWAGFEALLAGDWGTFEFLHVTTDWVAGVAALVLTAMTIWLVAPVLIEVVTAPFLDPLAEATEIAWVGAAMPAEQPGFWNSVIAGVKASAHVLLWQLVLLVPLLLLSLTGIGTVIAAVVAAWLNALIWFDIPCARRGYDLRERVALLRRNWARAIGFGLAFQVGMFVPFFNILFLTPAAAVATSALFFRLDKPRRLESAAADATVRDPGRPPPPRR